MNCWENLLLVLIQQIPRQNYTSLFKVHVEYIFSKYNTFLTGKFGRQYMIN